jgi:DnaJ domain
LAAGRDLVPVGVRVPLCDVRPDEARGAGGCAAGALGGAGAGTGKDGAAGLGAGGAGAGVVGIGTLGGGGSGTGTGTGRLGTGTDGTGTGGTGAGRSSARATAANERTAAHAQAPQMSRTQVQRAKAEPVSASRAFLPCPPMQQDHYSVLGVPHEATAAEIKQAYRRLARRLHPDVAERPADGSFQEVAAAYAVLSHPKRRLRYDKLGFRRRPARPAPAVPPLELELEWYEADRGVSKPVTFEESVVCDGCDGRGYERGITPGVCVACRGTGHRNRVTETDTLRYLEVSRCSACAGRGHDAMPACATCGGKGAMPETRAVQVRVPPKVKDGDQLAVEGIDQRFLLRVSARPRDSRLVLGVAAVALLCALGLLAFLLLR